MTIRFPSERKRKQFAFWVIFLLGSAMFSLMVPAVFSSTGESGQSPVQRVPAVSTGSISVLDSEKLNNLQAVQIQPSTQPAISPLPANQSSGGQTGSSPAGSSPAGSSSFQASQSDLTGQAVGRMNPFSPYSSPAVSPTPTPKQQTP